MPVEITLEKQFILTTKDKEGCNIALPEIKIAPTPDNNPFISSIVVRVTGEPDEIRSKIQTAYQPTNYGRQNPRMWQLQQQQQLSIGDCILDRSLYEFQRVNCHLNIAIEYCDSDVNGQPNQNRKSITQSSLLYYPQKKEKIEKPETSENLSNKEKSQAMAQNEYPQNEYNGWLAIDFGTSNSTVTIFDFKGSPDSTSSGFPKEQEKRLKECFNEWLNLPGFAGVRFSEWENFVQKVKSSNSIVDLKETINKIELSLNGTEKFRRAVSEKMSEIYAEVFRIPSLTSQNLFSVELEIGDRKISSLIEITGLTDPLTINMGNSIKQRQNDTFAQADRITEEMKNRFHFSPKRYLGQKEQKFLVSLEDGQESTTVTGDEIVKAAYQHLIQLTDNYRRSENLATGKFNKVVVTYPTVASPFVRDKLRKYINELGLGNVQTSYDEAIAVAMFYLFREFGGDLNVGIDSVKTRCRYGGQQWSQNVLVVDIGGGTTDIALINFTIQEKDLFHPGEDRGDGGRYYIITPKILGSSGNTQLGGELITLRLFRWLKVAIADCVLTAAQDRSLELEEPSLDDIIFARELEPFVEQGKFISGSLLDAVDYKQDDPQTDELKAAEKILSTHWKMEPRRLQTFYTLWKYAEDAKVQLAKGESEFVLTAPQITEILDQAQISYTSDNPDSLPDSLVVRLSQENFDRIVTPVIEEAIKLAEALVRNRFGEENIQKENTPELDWLILSGQTCHLPQVKEQIYQTFKTSNYFSCNPEKITFVPDFSKSATSIGACYTEKLLQLGFTGKNKASAIKEQLRNGVNQIEIQVENLFYYLPCSFKLATQAATEYKILFKTGKELSLLSPGESLAKARTDWIDAQLTTGVYREDFPGADLLYWGGFSGQTIAQSIGMTDDRFRDYVKLQFEIDQELNFKLFVCQGDAHYLIKNDIPSLKLNFSVREQRWPANMGNEPNEEGFKDGDIVTIEIDNHQDIAVNVFEGYTFDSPQMIAVVFKGDDLNLLFNDDKDSERKMKFFHYEEDPQLIRKGLISEPLPIFPNRGKHIFCQRDGDRWLTLGELDKPFPDFEGKYYATLDDRGELKIHAGEIPYYSFERKECLQQEGHVYVTALELQPQNINEFRDPFSGEQ